MKNKLEKKVKFPSNKLAEYPYKLGYEMHKKDTANHLDAISTSKPILKTKVISDMKKYIDERLRTYFSALAYKNRVLGKTELIISENGEFLTPYSQEILVRIPVSPMDSKPFLTLLHKEFSELINVEGFKRDWGELKLLDNTMYFKLNPIGDN